MRDIKSKFYNNGWKGLGNAKAGRFYLSTIGKNDKGQMVNSKENC